MMTVMTRTGRPGLAQVYAATMRDSPEHPVEFVDACDPQAGDRRTKWVLIVSSQFGCPVRCAMCDAGGDYQGNLTALEILEQVDQMIASQPYDPRDCAKLKVQFARMGEPSLNDEVLTALALLRERFPNVLPCIATIAPQGREGWFGRLLALRSRFSDFQLQFSLNTTDVQIRDRLMPYPKLPWEWIAEYGKDFVRPGQRKPVLNFAVSPGWPVEPPIVRNYFDPDWFAVKLTPLNPTEAGRRNRLAPLETYEQAQRVLLQKALEFEQQGYHVIPSIGNWEENEIGSNCGQAIRRMDLQRKGYDAEGANG